MAYACDYRDLSKVGKIASEMVHFQKVNFLDAYSRVPLYGQRRYFSIEAGGGSVISMAQIAAGRMYMPAR